MIALQTGLRHAEKIGGILALSTYLALESSLDKEASPANKRTPILMVHSTQRPGDPDPARRCVAAASSSRSYDLEWQTYPMPTRCA